MRPMSILVGTFVVYITMKGRFKKYMDLALNGAVPVAPGAASAPASVSSPSGAGASITKMGEDLAASMAKQAFGFD